MSTLLLPVIILQAHLLPMQSLLCHHLLLLLRHLKNLIILVSLNVLNRLGLNLLDSCFLHGLILP